MKEIREAVNAVISNESGGENCKYNVGHRSHIPIISIRYRSYITIIKKLSGNEPLLHVLHSQSVCTDFLCQLNYIFCQYV